ncbi:histidine kinase [Flavobacteriaceae bacterium]|nr:histidine kinase [Flavobacteriaceae bacterium]MDA9328253.1 histidine kinase [Flavobacteriaceae bacterium]
MILTITSAVSSYMMIYHLIPNYLLKKKYRLFVLYIVYLLIVLLFVIEGTVLIGFTFYFNLDYQIMPNLTKSFPVMVVCVMLIVSLISGIKLIQHNYKSILKNEDLKNKILQTQLQLKKQELSMLKMQIHPHFLFNSLNTIYGFALKKRDEAPEMILKLSNLLDYILYKIEKPTVSLENEINHLEDYISLEKLRFHDTLEVNLIKGDDISEMYIAPMLLIPFVENSFKHGAIIDGCLAIMIAVKRNSEMLFFEVENSVLEKTNDSTGIGLENIKKRLEMLYPNAYTLEINRTDKLFKVQLAININGLKTHKNVDES